MRPFKRKAIEHVRVVRFLPLHKIIRTFLSVGINKF